MQNLKQAKVGDTLHVTHPAGMWSGTIQVLSEHPNFLCSNPVLDVKVGPGVRMYFERCERELGGIPLSVETDWSARLTSLQWEND